MAFNIIKQKIKMTFSLLCNKVDKRYRRINTRSTRIIFISQVSSDWALRQFHIHYREMQLSYR